MVLAYTGIADSAQLLHFSGDCLLNLQGYLYL